MYGMEVRAVVAQDNSQIKAMHNFLVVSAVGVLPPLIAYGTKDDNKGLLVGWLRYTGNTGTGEVASGRFGRQ